MGDVFDEIAPDELAERPLSSAAPTFFAPLPAAPSGDIFDQLTPDPLSGTAAEEEGATKGRLRSAGASFMQGGGVGAGQTVSGLARLGDMLAAGYINDAGARQAAVNPEIASELLTEGRRLYNRTPEERERDIAANPVTKFGQELAAGAKEAFPENPKFRGEFFTSKIPSSAGQMVPTVAAGMVNPVLAAGQYGLAAGQAGAEESIAAGDLKNADKVFLSYLGLGALSELALGVPANVVRYLRAARMGGVDKAVARETIGRLMLRGATREAGQESLEQIGQNVVAQETFDPNRKTMAGVPESAAAGALLGGVVSGAAAATGVAGRSRGTSPAFFQQEPPLPPIEPATTTPEEQNARNIPSATRVPESEIRPPVGEAPPLRQPGQTSEAQAEAQSAGSNVPAQAPEVIEPEAARQKLWQNMQGREMDIPAAQWLQPASPHLRLVLGANAPSWRDLNFSGVVTANANPDGSYRVKVIPRTPEQVTPSAEPRATAAAEQPTNAPVSEEPIAPPPPVANPRGHTEASWNYVKKLAAMTDEDWLKTWREGSKGVEDKPVSASLVSGDLVYVGGRVHAETVMKAREAGFRTDLVRYEGRTWMAGDGKTILGEDSKPIPEQPKKIVWLDRELAKKEVRDAQSIPPPPVAETPSLGGSEANLPAQQREQSRRNNEAQAAQMRAELEAMGVAVPATAAPPAVAGIASAPVAPLPDLPTWRGLDHTVQRTGKDSRYVPATGERTLWPGVTSKRQVVDMQWYAERLKRGEITAEEFDKTIRGIGENPMYGRGNTVRPPAETSPIGDKPAAPSEPLDTLGNPESFYGMKSLMGAQMRRSPKLTEAMKFYAAKTVKRLNELATRRFAEMRERETKAPVPETITAETETVAPVAATVTPAAEPKPSVPVESKKSKTQLIDELLGPKLPQSVANVEARVRWDKDAKELSKRSRDELEVLAKDKTISATRESELAAETTKIIPEVDAVGNGGGPNWRSALRAKADKEGVRYPTAHNMTRSSVVYYLARAIAEKRRSQPTPAAVEAPPVAPVEEKTAPVRNDSTEFDRLIIEHGPELGWNGDYETLHAGQPEGGSTMAIEGKKRYSKALQGLRKYAASAIGADVAAMDSLKGRAAALPSLRTFLEGGMEAGVQTEIPDDASTDFLPPEDQSREFPKYPTMPKRENTGQDIFKTFGDAVRRWKERVSEWLKGKPENRAIIWEEPARGDVKGNVKALTRNIGNPEKPWRVTNYWERNGSYMSSGHQEYATREAALFEEARGNALVFHDRMPGRVMDEQEIKGYVRMADVGSAPLFWYTLGKKPFSQIKQTAGFQNGLVIDSLNDGEIAYARELDAEELQWSDLTPAAASPILELAQPESVEEQTARLATEETARKAKSEKEKVVAKAAAPLKGTAGDLGQGDLLGAPDDLFAPPAPKPLVDQAIVKIEDLQKRIRGSGSDVSMGVPKAILDLALEAARLALIAGRTVAQAIDAAVAKIRESVATFDEAEVRNTLERELASSATEDSTRGTVIDPATGQRVPDVEGGGDIVNIAGQEFNIMGKDRMTPEQKAAAASRVQAYFRNELELPGEPDNSVGTRRGSTDTNVVFKIQPDGENHDAAGEKLLAHLTEQIQMQHQPGGNPAYVSMLVNAINKNFNTGTLGQVLSRTMLDRLMNISVGESSWRGSMLRAITGITEDMVSVARNPMFFLRRTYENMFGGELVRKIMDRIANNFGESFTGEEIERIYNANPKLQELFNGVVDRLKVKPSLKEVIQEIFATRVDRQDDIVQKFVDTMVNKFSATPDEAARLKAEFGNTFAKSFEAARVKAQAKALATLLPEERKVIGPGTPLYKKLTDLVNSGWFDSAQVVQEYARSKGMIIPTEAEIERIRSWSIKEQSLREPTLEEIESNDANEAKAAAKVAAVTLETRQDLLRKMNTLWSRWTHPIIRNPRDVLDLVKRYNTAMAANEWLTANLLLKLGFGSRQLIDVGTQMVLHTPTRAAQYAFEQWSNDRSAGRDANLLDNLSQAITDAYRTRLKVLGDTLASFKRTLRGRGEQKNVEQLLSSIGVFDRALLKADEMKAEGRPAAARFLHLLALTLRFGRQFAAAADVIQGVPAEAQEMAHQIRTGLREQAKSKAQQELEFNTIFGLLTTARVESLSEARQMLELRGLDTSKTSIQRAAWHILREKIYEMARNAGLPADEWKAQNHYYRNVIGWNEPETQGLGRGKIGGPGGLVALTARAGKEVFAGAGLPAFPFVFGNAMGISLNRKLAYTPLGFWTSLFKGSPWFEGERNIRQRKIEAVIGTTIGSTLFTLAALGLWVVLPRKWPDDEKEKAKWTANGWQPGMVIIPAGDQEMKISTRVGPMSLLSPYLAAGGALRDAVIERSEKQAVLDERAQKLGMTAEKLEGLDASQWLNVVGSAAYASAMGGRTASGMLGSYTDFGNFSAKKSGAAATSTLIPGLPGYQEIARMAGANINPKLASFWDLLVPLPTSDANRVNLLGDPMRNENDVERVFQVLTGGTSPLPASSDQFKKNKAYANLFASDFRPPSINPTRGYQFGNEIRPMTELELQRYTTARGKNFASELQTVDVNGLAPDEAKKVVQGAFQRANAAALESVGATPTARASAAGAAAAQPPAPASQRNPTGRLRASLSRRTRTPAIGRVRSRVGRTRLATMRVPRLRRSRLRASLSRPRRGRFSVRSRMARTRRPRVRYV